MTYECLAKNLDVITANLPKAELGWGDEKVNLCMIFPSSCKLKTTMSLINLLSQDEYYDYIAEECWSSCKPTDSAGIARRHWRRKGQAFTEL